MKKYLPIALILGFMAFGFVAFLDSKPSEKNDRIYKIVQKYSPYYLDKRFGGLQIMSKIDPEFKETPNNMSLFKEFERLENAWGKKHLKLDESILVIYDFNDTQVVKVPLQTQDELNFIKRFYGLGK